MEIGRLLGLKYTGNSLKNATNFLIKQLKCNPQKKAVNSKSLNIILKIPNISLLKVKGSGKDLKTELF